MLFGSSLNYCLNPEYLGHNLVVTLGDPHLQLSTYGSSLLAIYVVYPGLSQIG